MSASDSLRLQVILNLVDKSTAVLKKIQGGSSGASKALKETRDRLKELNTTQKSLGDFRELRTGLRGTEAALEAAQGKVKALAQQLHASGPPTKAMIRDFDAAKRSAASLGEQHQRQGQQVQMLRDRLTSAGVSAGSLGTHERKLRADIVATTGSIEAQQAALRNAGLAQQRYQKGMAAGKSMAIRGVVAGGTGMAVAHGLHAPIEESKKFYTETQRIAALGLGPKVTADAISFGKGMKTYGTSTRDNLSLVRDGITIFGDLEHSEMVAPTLAKMKFANEAIFGEEQGKDNEKKFMDMLKVIELRGGLESEGKFKDQADKIQRVITATGGRVQGGEWLNVIKTGGVAAKGLTDEALYYQMEPLVQEMGGHRVGTSMMSAYSNIYQGLTTKRAAMKLDSLGLIADRSKVKHDKVGQVAQLGVGALEGSELFQQNQFEWMEKVLLPKLAAQGITGKKKVLDAMGGIFSNRTASNLFAQMYLQREQIHKNAKLNMGADGIGSLYDKAKDSASGKELELLARRADAYKEFGDAIMPAYIRSLELATSALQGFTGWMQQHPTLAKIMAVSLGVLALVLLAVGAAFITLGPAFLAFAMGSMMLAKLGGAAAVASTAMRVLGGAFAFIAANPVVLFFAALAIAIGAAAYLIYSNWGPISAFFGALWEKVKTVFNDAMTWFGALPARFLSFGTAIVQGLANGITGALGFVRDAITGAADSALSWFKEKLGIRSPSRVFMLAGAEVSAGAALGISGGYGDVRRAAAGLGLAAALGAPLVAGAEPLRFDGRAPLSSTAPASAPASGGNVYPIHIYPAPGMDPQAIALAVRAELQRIEREKRAGQQSRLTDYD